MLSTEVEKNINEWDSQLPTLMLAYRTSIQETTGATPFLLMFGRSARLPIDIEFDFPSTRYENCNQYPRKLHQQLQQAYRTVQENASVEQNHHKHLYDRAAHGPQYDVGDEVWLYCPAEPRKHCRKFHRPWQGPYIILKVFDNYVYGIQSQSAPSKCLTVHYI